jgi:outer membrane protein TolC
MFIPSNADRWIAVFLVAWVAGCATPQSYTSRYSEQAAVRPAKSPTTEVPPQAGAAPTGGPNVARTSYDQVEDPPAPVPADGAAADADDPFAGRDELPLVALVSEVQARNPSLQAMVAAWQAASQRYPQMISLEDPMFSYMIGPAGVGTMDGGGWMVMASQKLPWPGKRQCRGEAAQAEADMACRDVADTRLMLTEAAKMAFYDYYLARHQQEVNAGTTGLLHDFREIARIKYESSQVSQQDVLMADLEIGDLQTRRAELARMERVAVARINTLLHRDAGHRLPPPPARIASPENPLSSEELAQRALRQRPDLAAISDKIRAEQANLALAYREFYPDVEVVAKYDGFMPDNMRSQVGMNVNLPLGKDKRWAAVREVSSRLRQRQAEYQDRLDQVRYEVQSAYEQLRETQEVVRLFNDKILPTSRENIQSARAGYIAGKIDFLRLIEANRQFYRQQEKYLDATAEYQRRAAALERAVGGMLPPSERPGQP